MQLDPNLFSKYKKLEFKPTGMLFPVDWKAVRESNRCPLCGNKLYSSLKFPDSIVCRNKKHRFFKIKKFK